MFLINNTEFGIDLEKSSISTAQNLLNLEIYGSENTFDKLNENVESQWDWALYPPHFYLHEFPIKSEKKFEIKLTSNDLYNFEFALYMMEHNEFVGKIVMVNNQIKIQGIVDILGKSSKLNIEWQIA